MAQAAVGTIMTMSVSVGIVGVVRMIMIMTDMTVHITISFRLERLQVFVIWSWTTIVFTVVSFVLAVDNTAFGSEFVKSFHGEGRSTMMLGGGVVGFVDGHSGVDNLWLNGLFMTENMVS